jgi:hypothetical protein
MNEEQEREVELRVRERLIDERMERLDQLHKRIAQAGIALCVALWVFILADSLVTCEARRIVKEELSHK